MIPRSHIMEWSQQVTWQSNEQVEQDLVICRALVEIFSDETLANSLAFRGGTALHKLYLHPQPRYSEDIDLVQINGEPFGPLADRIRKRLSFLGEPKRSLKAHNFTLYYRFLSEIPPVFNLRLKVETNTREHFTVHGLKQIPFEVKSSWFEGNCHLTTYRLEELLGTKLRALYQRKKGRDLYDLFIALRQKPELDVDALLHSYREYISFSAEKPPTRREYLLNLEAKMQDSDFLGDTTALLRPDVPYNHHEAFDLVKNRLIHRM